MKKCIVLISLFLLSVNIINAQQADTSDGVFSIVLPLAAAQDIDFGKVFVGSGKDSLFNNFVINIGNFPIRIDSIYITGTDALSFRMISGFPVYKLDKGKSKYGEFSFHPKRIGVHNATAVIITQSDTMNISIKGEGVEGGIILSTNIIDFGDVMVGSLKDTIQAVTIKNTSKAPIEILSTKHSFPNSVDFKTLSGGGSFYLMPNETHKMDLQFKPSSIGRTSGTLEFNHRGVGSPAILQLYGNGLGNMVRIDDDSAYTGETRILKLRLYNKISPMYENKIKSFHAVLTYNSSVITTTDESINKVVNNSTERIELFDEWNNSTEILKEFEVICGLGNKPLTEMKIESFNWLDDKGSNINHPTEKRDGLFKILGLCYEGGVRLLNPNGNFGINSINPNPATDDIELKINLKEKDYTYIKLLDNTGRVIITIFEGNVSQFGINTFLIPTQNIKSGLYFLKLETPTVIDVQKIIIIK